LTPTITGSVTVIADTASITTGTTSGGSQASIRIIDLDYDPREVTVRQHATVTWTNAGRAPHTVTARDGAWTSELLQQRDQYLHVFDSIGRFEYFCSLHPNMVGTIVVTDSAGSALGTVTDTPTAAIGKMMSDHMSFRLSAAQFLTFVLATLMIGGALVALRSVAGQQRQHNVEDADKR